MGASGLRLKGDNGYHSSEKLYDLIVAGINAFRQTKPVQIANLLRDYPRDGHSDLKTLLDDNADMACLHRQDTMREIAKGVQGRYGNLLAPDAANISPLEIIFCAPGIMTLVRCNTQEAQQAIAGSPRTNWCIALNGAPGQSYFDDYQKDRAQYTLMLDLSGDMVAAIFATRSEQGGSMHGGYYNLYTADFNIEDHANKKHKSFTKLLQKAVQADPRLAAVFPNAAAALMDRITRDFNQEEAGARSEHDRLTQLQCICIPLAETALIIGGENAAPVLADFYFKNNIWPPFASKRQDETLGQVWPLMVFRHLEMVIAADHSDQERPIARRIRHFKESDTPFTEAAATIGRKLDLKKLEL
jgi:hypothetical protein